MERNQLEYIGWGIDPDLTDDNTFNYGLIDVTGYNEGDYWVDGEFLGPDLHGIVPIYLDANGQQFPEYAEQTRFVA